MENKFDDDFLEMSTDQINQAKKNSAFKGFTPKREFLIDLENFDLNQYQAEGICPGFLNEFNKCRNAILLFKPYMLRAGHYSLGLCAKHFFGFKIVLCKKWLGDGQTEK